MDLEIVVLSEVGQTQGDRYRVMLLICGIFKKKSQKTHIMNQKLVPHQTLSQLQSKSWAEEKYL